MRGLGPMLGPLLLLVALAGAPAQASCRRPPEPQQSMHGHLAPVDLLELAAPAVRYLRAFTTQCWLPDQSAPIAMFDNSWAVALVTIWSDLTGPSNGLGRLVTAMQLQTEAALMIDNKRPSDAISVLELAVLFTLYPVHHDAVALAAWHQSLASNHTMFAARRMSLARTLTLMARAQAAVGATSHNVDALEAAMIAGRAATELLGITDAAAIVEPDRCESFPDHPPPPRPPSMGAGTMRDIESMLSDVAQNTAKALREAKRPELERLLGKRGLKCRWKCGKRSALLKTLVPALRVPLRLVTVDGEEASSVDVPADLNNHLLPGWLLPEGIGVVERLGSIFAQVVATLQQPLLSDVGIKCTDREGTQQLHQCRDQAMRQFSSWSAGPPAPSHDMAALLGHVIQIEEALWRLDEVLEKAMTGVRLGDGTTWVKNRGYTWLLGKYMADKLYPQGQGAPVYYQTRRPAEPQTGSTICLDKTYLLDTVLRLDVEGLRGLQYALDNLQYAQFHAGGAEGFWYLLSLDNPMCRGTACPTGKDPITQLIPTEAGKAAPRAPRPMMVDFRFVSEQQLQANLAAATDPSYRVQDPFVAAFVSLCVVSCASLYLYSNRSRLVRALTPQRGRGSSAASSVSVVSQRNAATAALREALAGDNVSRQNVHKLHAAIDAAEATGVEKPLVKKAKAALQALKKRKQQQPGGAGGGSGSSGGALSSSSASLHRQQQQQQQQRHGLGSAAAAAPSVLPSAGSGLSSLSSADSTGSLTVALTERTAALLAAATEGWLESAGSGTAATMEALEEVQAQGSGTPAAAASTPPKATLLGPCSSEPELPTSPGTPVESVARSSPGDSSAALLSSPGCSPLPSPCLGREAAGRDGLLSTLGAGPPAQLDTLHTSPTHAHPTLHTAHSPRSPLQLAPAAPSPRMEASPPSESGSASTPTAACASADAPAGKQRLSQLTPRQQKKLLRLQQKHAAASAAAAAEGSTAASPSSGGRAVEDMDAAAALPPPPSPSQRALPSPTASKGTSDDVEQEASDAGPQLTEQQLKALAAREESAPSRQPRSAKKKAKQAAAAAQQQGTGTGSNSGSDLQAGASRESSRHGSSHGGGNGSSSYGGGAYGDREQRGERHASSAVRRTLSEPTGGDARAGMLSPLRQLGGSARSQVEMSRSMLGQDPRARHMAGYPAPTYWQVGSTAPASTSDTPLNANAPEFSPTNVRALAPSTGPSRHSPGSHHGSTGGGTAAGAPKDSPRQGGARGVGSGGASAAAFVGDHPAGAAAAAASRGGGGGGLLRTPSVPYSPNSSLSLSYMSSSGGSSLDPQQAAPAPLPPAPLAHAATTPALQQHQSLLAQLQQIWGEDPASGADDALGSPLVPAPPEQPLLPGFGAGGLGGPAGSLLGGPSASEQQQQQLAALLFMQHMEQQQQGMLGLGGLGSGGAMPAGASASPDSAPVSPQQLPPASADMLREVLGSPLSLLPHGSTPSGGWAAAGGAAAARTGSGLSAHDMQESLSLGRELAAAHMQMLRALDEAPGSPEGGAAGRPAARSLAAAVHTAALRASLDGTSGSPTPTAVLPSNHASDIFGLSDMNGGSEGSTHVAAAAAGAADNYDTARDGLRAHRIDSFDLEALGFTESGE